MIFRIKQPTRFTGINRSEIFWRLFVTLLMERSSSWKKKTKKLKVFVSV